MSCGFVVCCVGDDVDRDGVLPLWFDWGVFEEWESIEGG